MSKSILEERECRTCYVCGQYGQVEEHHIFYGSANRKKSEQWGLKVHLCRVHHRDYKLGVHGGNKDLDMQLKRTGQQAFEQLHSRKEFMKEFGKNYQ
ncbi:MAG: hypothetical protein RSF83_08490 [Hungatella sp.]